MEFLLKYKFTVAGIFAGALAGYLYYHFVGCHSGICSITSSPVNSTLYVSAMGGLFFNMFDSDRKRK
jgi:hypothetical protein